MVSLIMLYSDESIEESKALIKHIKYYVKPDGSLMTSPDIPPAEMLIKHLTGTFNSNQIVLSLSELISNTSKEFVYAQIISIYSKAYKSKITNTDIDKTLLLITYAMFKCVFNERYQHEWRNSHVVYSMLYVK